MPFQRVPPGANTCRAGVPLGLRRCQRFVTSAPLVDLVRFVQHRSGLLRIPRRPPVSTFDDPGCRRSSQLADRSETLRSLVEKLLARAYERGYPGCTWGADFQAGPHARASAHRICGRDDRARARYNITNANDQGPCRRGRLGVFACSHSLAKAGPRPATA
jgi:hypothetical protein